MKMKIVSLRTPKPYGQRTNVDILIEPKKKYFLVVEGSNTEIDYFYGIDNYRSELGIDQLIGIIPLERAEENTTDSHPMHLLNAALMKTGMIDAPENYELLEYDYKIDEIWLIFDRDPGSFHKEQFDKIYETCKEKDFHIGFTNPNFEFWLLLGYSRHTCKNRPHAGNYIHHMAFSSFIGIEIPISIAFGIFSKSIT
jgi:hypothetical protein